MTNPSSLYSTPLIQLQVRMEFGRGFSFLINSYYKQRFSDYLNDMRLAHFLSQVDASSLDSFTIESIATASGFAYKSSFYRAFKKKYGSTPTAYLQPLISAQNVEKSS